ncbi:MAG: hypothetical protein WC879_03530 [Melioribacteraceae bacterium]
MSKSKKKDFRELSDRKCKDCGKKLKQNLVDKNSDAERCYKCNEAKNRKEIQQKYQQLKQS